MGEALNQFVAEAQGLAAHFDPHTVFSIGGWEVTQYVVWLFIALAVTFAVVLISAKKLQLIPTNKFFNTVEYGYEFVNKSIAEDVIGNGFKQHVPFLATMFFFILICNILGLIPGFKTATGAISCTWALAAISFVYFNYYGLKKFGLLGYFKNLCPSGVPKPMVPVIWFLELFSIDHSCAYACSPTLRQHARRPYDARHLRHRNHLLHSAGSVCRVYGPHRRLAFHRMVRAFGAYVCHGVLGRIHPGVRFRHPFRVLRQYGDPRALSA